MARPQWLPPVHSSFGLHARPKGTVLGTFFLSALSVFWRDALILEMYRLLGGYLRILDAPLNAALSFLGQ